MAQPHRNSSFSYKSINPKIQTVLKNRSDFRNRTQLAMPFVKATTTLNGAALVGSGFTGEMFGFTLGLHAVDKDAAVQDIYADANGNALVGYTYVVNSEGKTNTQYIYAKETNDVFLNKSSAIESDLPSGKIPPPGITSVTIGRIRNGVVSSADINFTVPSISQLEMLHRTFLVPGIGMVLEWGQQFSVQARPVEVGEDGLTKPNDVETGTIDENMFPWYNRDKLLTMVNRLAKNTIGLDEIMNCYVHPTQGQYQWMFGRVANFTTKANADGSYDCTVKIVGPAEESWAYSVRNTAVPSTSQRDGSQVCSTINSVESYFNKTTTSTTPINFFTVLQEVGIVPRTGGAQPITTDRTFLTGWDGHVIKLEQGNDAGGVDSSASAASADTLGDSEDAYYISWRFFVNVILNHPEYGIKSIFKQSLGGNQSTDTDPVLEKISVLRPYGSGLIDTSGDTYIDDPYENFVGNNKYLRSTDLNTLIIVNETAATNAEEFLRFNNSSLTGAGSQVVRLPGGDGPSTGAQTVTVSTNSITAPTVETETFVAKGDFFLSDTAVRTANKEVCPVDNDRGLLSAGVWINHKAIVQSFVSANTIADGLTNLLNRMNSATSNFWNLTLDVSEPIEETCGTSNTPVNYTVTDMNYRESSDVAVKDFIDKVYLFNKYVRKEGNNKFGSEVIDCTVDMNLPKRLFSQIATLGLSQPNESQDGQAQHSSIIGDNDTLREMFGITQLSNRRTGISADLTLPFSDRSVNSQCGGASVNSTPVGAGNGSTPSSAAEGTGLNASATKQRIDVLEKYQGLNICTTDACASRLAAVEREAAQAAAQARPGGDCRSAPIGPASDTNAITRIEGVNSSARGWTGRELTPIQTPLTLEEAFNILKDMNCTKELIVNILMAMRSEQGRGTGFRTANYNYSGFDISTSGGGWDFNPEFHDGYVYRREGTTGVCKPYVSFKNIELALYVKATALVNKRGFQELDPRKHAETYYRAWNSCGARTTLPNKDYPIEYESVAKKFKDECPATSADNPFKEFDESQIATVARRFTTLLNEVRNLPGWNQARSGITTLSDIRKPTVFNSIANVTRPTPRPTPTPAAAVAAAPAPAAASTPAASPAASGGDESISLAQRTQDLASIVAIKLTSPGAGPAPSTCDECVRQKRELVQLRQSVGGKEQQEEQVAAARRQTPNLTTLFRYLEIFPDQMVANITNTANGNGSNAFGAAPGSLSINAELTLPGINGLRVGELFWIDKVPSFYRIFGAFQIINIQDVIGRDGWTTKISAKFNYLGNAWKRSSLQILNPSS